MEWSLYLLKKYSIIPPLKSTKRQIALKIFFIFSVGCLYHNFGVIIIFIQEILDNPSLKSSKYKKTNSIEDFFYFQCGVCLNFLRWRLGYPLPRIMDLLPTVHTIQIKWSPTRTGRFPSLTVFSIISHLEWKQ